MDKKVNYYISVYSDSNIKDENYDKGDWRVKWEMRLAIFDTFKTKGDSLTGEANRQRAIITILGSNANPAERTRTGISQRIAKKGDVVWKNIYSGIFRDLDEILLPMNIAEEDGRLPLKRGPKALQEKGIPYYHLTKEGTLVALAISDEKNSQRLLEEFFLQTDGDEKEFEKVLASLVVSSPKFTHLIFEKYVKAFCDGKIAKLLPFELSKLGDIPDESLVIQREILEAFLGFSKQDKDDALGFLNKIIAADVDNAKH